MGTKKWDFGNCQPCLWGHFNPIELSQAPQYPPKHTHTHTHTHTH